MNPTALFTTVPIRPPGMIPAALLVLGDASSDTFALHYLAIDDLPLPAEPAGRLLSPPEEHDDDDNFCFAFAADAACPTPERCAFSGCRGKCLPPPAA